MVFIKTPPISLYRKKVTSVVVMTELWAVKLLKNIIVIPNGQVKKGLD